MKKSTKNVIKNSCKALSLVALFAVVISMEYQDESVAVQQYCENVKDNTWPNYKEVDLNEYCN